MSVVSQVLRQLRTSAFGHIQKKHALPDNITTQWDDIGQDALNQGFLEACEWKCQEVPVVEAARCTVYGFAGIDKV